MRFWRLDSYSAEPADDAIKVGAIIASPRPDNPATWISGTPATHYNGATKEWVAARWVEVSDPRGGAS